MDAGPMEVPVAAKMMSPDAMSAVEYLRARLVIPRDSARLACPALAALNLPWIWPPVQRSAAAAKETL